ncbi:MAG TPA: hypothetical protein DEP42_00370 [Ruminococcaceae bacterium]|nr:hypothetical protein [Oscillospiraceae bacterium]
MKDFLRKYGVYLGIHIAIITAFCIASTFDGGYLLAALLCFAFLFLPTLVWSIHSWENEREQKDPPLLKKKNARFWHKFRSLFIFHGIIIGILTMLTLFESTYSNSESLSSSIFILFALPAAFYLFAGVYIAGALIGVHLIRKKRMSTKDILFSVGIWLILTAICFWIPISTSSYALSHLSNLPIGNFLCPVLGSTCALFFAEIITKSVLESRK